MVSGYTFKDLDKVALRTKTDHQQSLEKMDDVTEVEYDVTYAISLSHENKIERVMITYRYLGLTDRTTIEVPFGLR